MLNDKEIKTLFERMCSDACDTRSLSSQYLCELEEKYDSICTDIKFEDGFLKLIWENPQKELTYEHIKITMTVEYIAIERLGR